MSLKIEVVQLEVFQGEFKKNWEQMKEYIRKKKSSTQLIVFPQYAITGYPTLKFLKSWEDEYEFVISEISKTALKYGTGILFSAPKLINNNNFEDNIYYVDKNGVVNSPYIRMYKFWREDNCVTGTQIKIIEINKTKIGIIAGDDIYYPEILRELVKNGAVCIICLFYNSARKLDGNCLELNDVLKNLTISSAVVNEVDFILCSADGQIEEDDDQSLIANSLLVGNSGVFSISESQQIFFKKGRRILQITVDESKINFYRMINRRSQNIK